MVERTQMTIDEPYYTILICYSVIGFCFACLQLATGRDVQTEVPYERVSMFDHLIHVLMMFVMWPLFILSVLVKKALGK